MPKTTQSAAELMRKYVLKGYNKVVSGTVLTPKELETLMLIKEHGPKTAHDIAQLTNVIPATARQRLDCLVRKGYLDDTTGRWNKKLGKGERFYRIRKELLE